MGRGAVSRQAGNVINHFVRFGYRRPLPWPPGSASSAASSGTETGAEAARAKIDAGLADNLHDELGKASVLRNVPPSIRKELGETALSEWQEVDTQCLRLRPIPVEQNAQVPTLCHGLDVVLRGSGLYPLETPWDIIRTDENSRRLDRDPKGRTRRFFSDSLTTIVQPDQIDWSAIPAYIPAARDGLLHRIGASCEGVTYCSSTSSMTPSLSVFYHLISNFSPTALVGGLSAHIRDLPASFSRIHRKPVAITLGRTGETQKGAHSKHIYSVSAHSGINRGPPILRNLGHTMERMLTSSPQEFARRYVLSNVPTVVDTAQDNDFDPDEQFFHYTQADKFLLRAQIDCRNEETGHVFDLKTRAVAPIRYDLDNYEAFIRHRLRFLHGRHDSYEREFYDMVRSVFLKYALQLRIGRMNGALVAYHNTTQVLGFEYVQLKEIEAYVFGNKHWADTAFAVALRLMSDVLDRVVNELSPRSEDESVKVVFMTEWTQLQLWVFAQRFKKPPRDETEGGVEEQSDMFGPRAFENVFDASQARYTNAPANTSKNDNIDQTLWHVDASVNSGLGSIRGVAAVGAHKALEAIGASRASDGGLFVNRVADDGTGSIGIFANQKENDLQELLAASLKTNQLNNDNFRAWRMSFLPTIHGALPSQTAVPSLGFDSPKRSPDQDAFRLRYNVVPVVNAAKDEKVVARFVSALSSIYLK